MTAIPRKRLIRFLIAAASVLGTVLALSLVHDYQRTRYQIELIRTNNPIAVKRPWLVLEYFLNEAGSGVKYFVTGNEKHMRHYPTDHYLLEKTLLRAHYGGWRSQVSLARRYYDGRGVPRDIIASLLWMRSAQGSAPFHMQHEISTTIRDIEAEIIRTHI